MALPHHPVGLPAFPRWSWEAPRWVPRAFGSGNSSRHRTDCNSRSETWATCRFPLRDPESSTDWAPASPASPASPQSPCCAGSWRNWSHFLEMLQSQALSTQPPTHRLAPPPVSTAFTHVAGSLSPSHSRHPQTHALRLAIRGAAEVTAKLGLSLGQVTGVARSPIAGTPHTRRVART